MVVLGFPGDGLDELCSRVELDEPYPGVELEEPYPGVEAEEPYPLDVGSTDSELPLGVGVYTLSDVVTAVGPRLVAEPVGWVTLVALDTG